MKEIAQIVLKTYKMEGIDEDCTCTNKYQKRNIRES